MNIHAIAHVPDSQDCFPLDDHLVELRLRVSAQDSFEKIQLAYGNKYDFHQKQNYVELRRSFCDGRFDYYTIILPLEDVRFVYVFILTQNGADYFFSEDGVTDSYDYTRSYYNAFQLPYINSADIIPVNSWMPHAVFYNIFVDRFYRGDEQKDESYINLPWGQIPEPKSFSGGDLKGITKKLDYIKGLGATAIYLTPIFCSISNHKYDIYDYYHVDPQFGTNDDLRELVSQAHSRGMKVVLDAVFNHCSERLEQFQDVVTKGYSSEYHDWFIINGDKPDAEKGNFQCFSSCAYMPKFNTSNPDVARFLIDIALYWIREYDIDGWRLDVSDEVSHHFWRQFRQEVKSCKPDAVIIGENWHDARPFLCGDQFDGIMNYSLTKALTDYFAERTIDARGFANKLNSLYVRNTRQTNFMMMNLLDSHDTHRFYTLTGCDMDSVICALAVIFLHPGAAGVYYGTECPLEGGYDPDCRRTMNWDVESAPTPISQIIRQLSAVRSAPAVRQGDVRYMERENMFVMEREYGSQIYRLTVNNTGLPYRKRAEGRVLASYNYSEETLVKYAFILEEVSV